MSITPTEALVRCIEHREIFHDEMLSLWRKLMGGELTQVQIAGLLMGLRVKKETIGEIAAAAQIITPASAPARAISPAWSCCTASSVSTRRCSPSRG